MPPPAPLLPWRSLRPLLAQTSPSGPLRRLLSSSSSSSSEPSDRDRLHGAISSYAGESVRPVTIRDLTATARAAQEDPQRTLLSHAQFLQGELPVRLARLVCDLQRLPFIVGMNPYIRAVYTLYCKSFEALAALPPIATPAQEQAYTDLLKGLVEEHRDVVPTLSKGMLECRKYISPPAVRAFLDRKIHDRIGIRVLAEQHIALHAPQHEGYAGIINTRLSPAALISSVGRVAQEMCAVNYGVAPEVELVGATDAVFPYIPVHLEYVVFELLKNAMRATVEWCEATHQPLHPVQITIGKGPRDITFRISDRGGGVPDEELESVWEYSFSTMQHGRKTRKRAALSEGSVRGEDQGVFHVQATQDLNAGVGGPMAGLGYGLPMSRVYAAFFGGNLDLVSMHGHGCDVFLRLNHLEDRLEATAI